MAATTSRRDATSEIERQIKFQQTMKDRALEKYLAKVAEIDGKIETLKGLKDQVASHAA